MKWWPRRSSIPASARLVLLNHAHEAVLDHLFRQQVSHLLHSPGFQNEVMGEATQGLELLAGVDGATGNTSS
jgi:hypothetical protein